MSYLIPKVGDRISVTTRYKSIYYLDPPGTINEFHYVGTVVEAPQRDGNHFGVRRDDSNHIPILNRHKVHDMIVDGVPQPQEETTVKPKSWIVEGSKGNTYTVELNNGQANCTCPGFRFRNSCKHAKAAEAGEYK